jgi:hypothetical protein
VGRYITPHPLAISQEYPGATRELGLNEIKMYDTMCGASNGFFTELIAELPHIEDGNSTQSSQPDTHIPRLYGMSTSPH